MKKKLYHCTGCTDPDPLGGTHNYDTIEHGEQPMQKKGKLRKPVVEKPLCQHCHKRPATIQWVGDGGMLAFTHGMYENWCDFCATTEQLKAARRSAKHIPRLEKKLKKLK